MFHSMVVYTEDKKLKTLLKVSMREVLDEELMKIRALAMPDVSDKEQADIIKRFGRAPTREGGVSHILSVSV
jgi:hypothetical protein